MSWERKTDKVWGALRDAIMAAGAGGKPFTRKDVKLPEGFEPVNLRISLWEYHRLGRLRLVKPAKRGRYGSPPVYQVV